MLENISYLDDQSSFRSKEKYRTSPSRIGRFYSERELPLVLFSSMSFLLIQLMNAFVGHCFPCSYAGTLNRKNHIQVLSGAISPSAGHCSGMWKLTKVLQLPTEVGSASHKRKVRSGSRGFAFCWQTISLSNWPIFCRIISPKEWSTAAL